MDTSRVPPYRLCRPVRRGGRGAVRRERQPAGARLRARDRHLLPSRAAIATLVDDLRAALFPGHFGPADLTTTSLRYAVGTRLDKAQAWRCGSRCGAACRSRAPTARTPPTAARASTAPTRSPTRSWRSCPRSAPCWRRDIHAAFVGDPAAQHRRRERCSAIRASPPSSSTGSPTRCTLSACRSCRASSPSWPTPTPASTSTRRRAIGAQLLHRSRHRRRHRRDVRDRRAGPPLPGRDPRRARFPSDEHGCPIKGLPRHPIVEDDVVIYAGATILGRITSAAAPPSAATSGSPAACRPAPGSPRRAPAGRIRRRRRESDRPDPQDLD